MVLTLDGLTITETGVFLLLHQSLPHRPGDHSLPVWSYSSHAMEEHLGIMGCVFLEISNIPTANLMFMISISFEL